MRRPVDRGRLADLLRALGRTGARGRIYLAGGATAVSLGWRESTIDVDLVIEGDEDVILRAIPALKEALEVNVELAAPHQFLPEVPGWRERSPVLAHEGALEIRHYDLRSQALAKLERGHARDRSDVAAMLERGLVRPAELWVAFRAILPKLHRYPAVDPERLRGQLEAAIGPEPPADAAVPR